MIAHGKELTQMPIRSDGERTIAEVTRARVEDLLKGMQDIRAGTGDYAIRPREDLSAREPLGRLDRESLCRWFWPCFGHLGID